MKKKFFLLLGLFILFSFWVDNGNLRFFDLLTTKILQSITPYFLDPFLSWFSLFGSFFVITFLTFVILVALRRIRIALNYIFVSFFLHLIEIFGKNFIFQPIPPKEILRTKLPFYLSQPEVKAKFAYPSGHSMRTVLTGIIFFYLISKSQLAFWKKVILNLLVGAFVVIMLYSRISLGEHWLADVVGGTILGLLGGLILLKVSESSYV